MKRLLYTFVFLAISAQAGPETWIQHGLIMPETISRLRAELELTNEQETKMLAIVSEAQAAAEPLEKKVKETQKSFNESLKNRETSADAASAALTQLLEAEAPVKQLQLRTLIQLRDCMTPEQQKKAMQLAPGKVAKKSDLEPRVRSKVEKLRAAVDALGIKSTRIMTQRGGEIEALIRQGQWAKANEALDKLIEDSRLNEPESTVPVDFSQEEQGNVDLEVLKQRLADVQADADSIISLPLIRQFIQAKKALDAAKEAQDAELVGRILTWGEKKLTQQ
ncbi:MAG: Spy/CpxP family protein refolding chaperone [Verrucomicrobia bacterium]|nr:Spy/CpxP family protein refolding chaperone [Verrucomicrobiota bacterium]